MSVNGGTLVLFCLGPWERCGKDSKVLVMQGNVFGTLKCIPLNITIYELHTAVSVKIQVSCDAMLRSWASGFQHTKGL
jgi:hypothetical protein